LTDSLRVRQYQFRTSLTLASAGVEEDAGGEWRSLIRSVIVKVSVCLSV